MSQYVPQLQILLITSKTAPITANFPVGFTLICLNLLFIFSIQVTKTDLDSHKEAISDVTEAIFGMKNQNEDKDIELIENIQVFLIKKWKLITNLYI